MPTTNIGKPQSSCSVCEKTIEDESEDSIFCEGICNDWMHRTCAGLSKVAFKAASESEDKFHCHYCSSKCLRDEIKALKDKVSYLDASLKSQPATTNTTSSTLPRSEQSGCLEIQSGHSSTYPSPETDPRSTIYKLLSSQRNLV